ncbi:MAG TPA: 4'-phosphopantetheinyl transferase superfamily protein [Acidimicrobiales bacterium]|nr:4'-phosphopantetheinyl transferase superfamily protein [Acidimicrobiales bacterium]
MTIHFVMCASGRRAPMFFRRRWDQAGAVDETFGGLRVGTDLVAVDDVAESVARFGDRYVGRVYTAHEVSCCQGPPSVVAAGLAARFAAKEATIKVLRPVDHQPDWRSIEIRRDPAGWCAVHLTGGAARMARQQGIRNLAVSLTHESGMAAAVVVAVCDGGEEKER